MKLFIWCYLAAAVTMGVTVAFIHSTTLHNGGSMRAPYVYVIAGALWPITGATALASLLVPPSIEEPK